MRKLLVVLMALAFMMIASPALAMAEVDPEAAAQAIDWAWLNGVVAFALPLAISFFKKAEWSVMTKKVFAFLLSAVVGVVTVGFNQGWDFVSIADFARLAVLSISQIWVVAQVAYLSFWQDSKPEVALANMGASDKVE